MQQRYCLDVHIEDFGLLLIASDKPWANFSCAKMKKSRDRISGSNMTRKTLAKALRRLYDPILNEPIPQRLISMLRHKIKGERPAISMQDAHLHAKKN
jgi:hypothetical protein